MIPFLIEESKFSRKFCEALAQRISVEAYVPQECKRFDNVMVMVRRRESVRSARSVAFEGMSPGEAHAAMAAMEKGYLNPMQIQRRMTNRKSKMIWYLLHLDLSTVYIYELRATTFSFHCVFEVRATTELIFDSSRVSPYSYTHL